MQETIGQRLKRAREYRNISLEKAGEITRIRPSLLKALEADDFSNMVSAAQARGFLRNYSEYLGLKFDDLIAQVESKPAQINEVTALENPEQIVGPLEKIDPLSTGAVSGDDQPRTRRELPFWKRTLSMLPSKASQQLESNETEINSTQNENPGQANQPEVSRAGLTSDTVGTVKASEAESQDEHGTQRAEDLVEAIGSSAKVESKPSDRTSGLDLAASSPEIEGTPIQPGADAATVQEETGQLMIEQAVGVEPDFLSRVNKLTSPFINRIKSIFKFRIEGLQAPKQQADTHANAQANPESAELPLGIPVIPEKPAENYFSQIGESLRERRAMLSLTFEEIERHTHIRTPFLKAMENGAHDQLPSPVQTRGLLSNYASFLDLDADQLLLSYAAALQARHRERHPELARTHASIRSKPILPPIRTFIASDVLFGVGVIGIVIGLAIWGLGRLLNPPAVHESVESTAPSIAEVLAGTAIADQPLEVTLIAAQDTPLPTFEATQEIAQGDQELASDAVRVQVSLLAVARTFVRVTSDGEVVFNDQVIPGNSYPFEADEKVEVLVGNGAALKVTYAGRDLGLMGSLGEVVNRIYTLSGISTPTITPLPSATATPAMSSTPTLSITATRTP